LSTCCSDGYIPQDASDAFTERCEHFCFDMPISESALNGRKLNLHTLATGGKKTEG